MKELYLEIFSTVDGNGTCWAPIESLVVLFGYKFCEEPSIQIILVQSDKNDRDAFETHLGSLRFEILIGQRLPPPADLCALPVMITHEGTTCVAGLCAVTRQVFKTTNHMHPLLGFKQSCLYACAEASLWTRFCEVDALNMVHNVLKSKEPVIPHDVGRFEAHMAQPVRAHNIQKVKQDALKAAGGARSAIPDARLQLAEELNHLFAEGASVSIADVILMSCFHIVLTVLASPFLEPHIPLTYSWYKRMLEISEIKTALVLFGPLKQPFKGEPHVEYVSFKVPPESLYKSDPRRYKPRNRIYTRQEDIEESLEAIKAVELDMIQVEPFGAHIAFDWESVPWDAQPGGGALPEQRVTRKAQQLEGMTRAVLAVVRHGDRVVDFCAGSGHLGLILAHSLPRCTIVLLENKEESLSRARERATKLHLANIVFCQSNVDYFSGDFTIGVSLHACGVATDLVLETCIQRRAVFVSCPCCYGSVQPNHMVQYPRSDCLRTLPLTERQYLVLGHAADQTHDAAHAKTNQGLACMNVIDGDRCLRARQAGYRVLLSKLHPPTCTPKNNLLIGIPNSRLDSTTSA